MDRADRVDQSNPLQKAAAEWSKKVQTASIARVSARPPIDPLERAKVAWGIGN